MDLLIVPESTIPHPSLDTSDNKKLDGMTTEEATYCGLQPIVSGAVTLWITTKGDPLLVQNSKGDFKKLFPLDKDGNTTVYLFVDLVVGILWFVM